LTTKAKHNQCHCGGKKKKDGKKMPREVVVAEVKGGKTNWLQLGHEERQITTKYIGVTHQPLSDMSFFNGKPT
jgi:hypothetical protein